MIGLRNRGALPTTVQDEFENLIAKIKAFFLVEHNEDGTHITTSGVVPSPTGGIVMWSTAVAPTGWLLCQGDQVNRNTYKALFDIIGTTYGAGDGSTTFTLPDLRQKFVLGKAAAGTGATLAGTGGLIDHTHTGPSHTHTGPSHTHTGPSHTHTGPSHTHSFSDTSTSQGDHTHSVLAHRHAIVNPHQAANGADFGYGATATNDDIFDDSGTSSNGAHTHDVSGTTGADGTGNTGAAGTGATGADGTGATGADGTGATSAANPPFIALMYIIKY